MGAKVMEGIEATRVPGGRTIQEVEADFRKPGKTMIASVFGGDPLDFWVGPFYVGFWGMMTIVGILIGTYFYVDNVILNGPYSYPQNFFAGRLEPPPAELGRGLAAPGEPGFEWQMTVFFATLAFVSWALREVDICRKLEMGYHVPISFGIAISAWVILQFVRPMLMGQWHEGFTLGVMPHLDWIANFGYRYYNFLYNPFHCLGVSGLFASTLLLAMHGSAILSAAQSRSPDVINRLENFWLDSVGYTIGEDGIHRLAAIVAAFSFLTADLCILFSGWLVQDWISFYNFWNNLPFWTWV
jgi:hypothetical protein